MQKSIILKTQDNKKIYGVLDEVEKKDKLIIFVHGLTGHKNEHIFFNAARFFPNADFSCFRFDLYTDEPGARRLDDCTVTTHSRDLETVINHFASEYQEIFLVGHSLGGATILSADLSKIKKIVLWDPSGRLNPDNEANNWYEYNEKLEAYLVRWGTSTIVSQAMVKEWESADYEKWIDNCRVPLKVICAEQEIGRHLWKKLIEKFKVEKEFVVVEGASHCFDEAGTEERLFVETVGWF